jgi:hypothetical protein
MYAAMPVCARPTPARRMFPMADTVPARRKAPTSTLPSALGLNGISAQPPLSVDAARALCRQEDEPPRPEATRPACRCGSGDGLRGIRDSFSRAGAGPLLRASAPGCPPRHGQGRICRTSGPGHRSRGPTDRRVSRSPRSKARLHRSIGLAMAPKRSR